MWLSPHTQNNLILPSDFATFLLVSRVCLYCSFSWVLATTESGPLWDCLLDRHPYAARCLLYDDNDYRENIEVKYLWSRLYSICGTIARFMLPVVLLVFLVKENIGQLRRCMILQNKSNVPEIVVFSCHERLSPILKRVILEHRFVPKI